MTPETIEYNVNCFIEQMKNLLDFSADKMILANNAEWLVPVGYLDFIREVGPHFTINRMLSAECYKQRLETGLSFLEFNYMMLQAYDFLMLFRKHGCRLQVGGDDQWSNIIAGTELIRKKEQEPAFGLTFKLLETSGGQKMGKTAKGALWLDESKCSVYDFYQYWRNIDDADVSQNLRFMTFLEMNEIREYDKLEGADINQAKKRLAYEVTALVHGHAKAKQAEEAALSLFERGGDDATVPSEMIAPHELGSTLIDILAGHGLMQSKGAARRLIEQGGLYVGDEAVTELFTELTENLFTNNELIIRLGKKRYIKLIIEN
jgi:tyrosyl-tRNA synthetase